MDAVGVAHQKGKWYCHINHTGLMHQSNHEGVQGEDANVIMGFPAPVHGCEGCQVIRQNLKENRPYSKILLPDEIRKELQKIYNRGDRSSPKTCRFDPTKENIAVHIRRGDIERIHNEGGHQGNRFIGNAVYQKEIQLLRDEHKTFSSPNCSSPKELVFHIFSEGPDKEFADLLGPNGDVLLHNKDPAFPSFRCMVTADRLVTAWSSFSRTAGVLSHGIVYETTTNKHGGHEFTHNDLTDYYANGMVMIPIATPPPYTAAPPTCKVNCGQLKKVPPCKAPCVWANKQCL